MVEIEDRDGRGVCRHHGRRDDLRVDIAIAADPLVEDKVEPRRRAGPGAGAVADAVPVEVRLPVTINGRIFPRGNVDAWSFQAMPNRSVTCAVRAARLGSPLDAHVQVFDPRGRVVAESTSADGPDPVVHFVPTTEGRYQVRIQDVNGQGGPAFVYRLTLTADAGQTATSIASLFAPGNNLWTLGAQLAGSPPCCSSRARRAAPLCY